MGGGVGLIPDTFVQLEPVSSSLPRDPTDNRESDHRTQPTPASQQLLKIHADTYAYYFESVWRGLRAVWKKSRS